MAHHNRFRLRTRAGSGQCFGDATIAPVRSGPASAAPDDRNRRDVPAPAARPTFAKSRAIGEERDCAGRRGESRIADKAGALPIDSPRLRHSLT
jgi:hypothetical protein